MSWPWQFISWFLNSGAKNIRASSVHQCLVTSNIWKVLWWPNRSPKACVRHRVRTQPPSHYSATISSICLRKVRFKSEILHNNGCGSFRWSSNILYRWKWKVFWMGRIYHWISCGQETCWCHQVIILPFFNSNSWEILIVPLWMNNDFFFVMVNLASLQETKRNCWAQK